MSKWHDPRGIKIGKLNEVLKVFKGRTSKKNLEKKISKWKKRLEKVRTKEKTVDEKISEYSEIESPIIPNLYTGSLDTASVYGICRICLEIQEKILVRKIGKAEKRIDK